MSEAFWLAVLILGLVLCFFIGQVIVMLATKSTWGEYSTRILVLILVIGIGGSIVASGLSMEKTGHMISLLGVIIGYLFGSWGKKG